jgi:hypothetical protein
MKREASKTPFFEKWLRLKKFYCYWEVKQTTTDSIAFSSVPEHQIDSLLAQQDSGLLWKHSDSDMRTKPCDGQFTPPLPAVVVIKYPKEYCVISINNFIFERDHSKRKSLTVERAREISTYIIK